MTENSKIPAAQKTIEDPPEYAAATGEAAPSSSLDKLPPWSIPAAENEAAPSSSDVSVTGFGGEREATYQQNGQSEVNDRGRVPADDVTEQKAPKGSLSGGAAGRMGTGNIGDDFLGGPQDVAEAPNEKESGPTGSGKYAAPGEGARNTQTGETDRGRVPAEENVNDRGRVPADDVTEKKAPKGSLSGGEDEQEGGGPDV
jgi:hypothetical protein